MSRRMFNGSRPWSRPVLALVLGMVLGMGAVASAAPVEVVHSGTDGVRFEVKDLQVAWRARTGVDGPARHDLAVGGFTATAAGGGPRLPQRTAWILVPPGTRPELVVLAEKWGDGGDRLLAQAPLTATRLDGQGGGELVELMLEPGAPLPTGHALSEGVAASRARAWLPRGGAAVELGESRPWRGRRVARLAITPVRYDGEGRATGVLESGRWEVRFVRDAKAPTADMRRVGTANDDRFAGIFMNSDLLLRTPTEASFHGAALDGVRPGEKAANGKAATLLAPEIKLGVITTRLHRVSAQRLRSQNLLPDTPVSEDEVRLYQRRYLPRLDDGSGTPPYAEIEVPIHMVGDGGLFEGDDFFVFYGLRMRDDTSFTADLGDGPETIPAVDDPREWNNNVNVYWLAAAQPQAGESWARMETAGLPAATQPTLRSYRRVDRHEEQVAFGINPHRGDDRTYYNAYSASEFTLLMSPQWSPDPDGADATLSMEATASSTRPTFPTDLTVYLDIDLEREGMPPYRVGTLNLRDTYDRVYDLPAVPAANLPGNGAKLVMVKAGDWMWSFINWVEISYDAFYRASSGRLDFHTGDQVGGRPIGISGFLDQDIGLLDVTDPRAPRFVQLVAANVLDDGGSWSLSILPSQSAPDAPRRYSAVSGFSGGGVDEFEYYQSVVADDPVSPVIPTGDRDVLVVTHGDFAGSLERWEAHRKARAPGDLTFHVVDEADIWDWFGGGMRSPEAIKRLVEHSRDRWNTWALVMVGDANENSRELGVHTNGRPFSRDWVPTHYHVQNALSGVWEWMATDKWYVTSETTNFPDNVRSPWEMYTGRFPVNSPEDLDNVIDKIILMETPGEGQDWRRRGVFLADDSWSDGYGADAGAWLEYRGIDETFLDSERDNVSVPWSTATPAPLESDLVRIAEWLDPVFTTDPGEIRDVSDVRAETENGGAAAGLRQALQQGALVAHYQGHANARVLSSEFWLKDQFPRRDIAAIGNTTPWVFFGMGCHVSDWAQNTVTVGTGVNEPAIGEKILVGGTNGAVATYGSSGYEYITEIGYYCGVMMDRWLRQPPTAGLQSGASRSRWMLGELMWATEADILASRGWDREYREMATQFVILGDPLMILDAGPPEVTAILKGTPDGQLQGEVDIEAIDAANLRILEIAALDEAGIDRLMVSDDAGRDLTSQVVAMADSLPPGETDHQETHYRLAVPIRPYAHALEVEVWDTGAPLPADRHWTLIMNVGQEADLTSGGEPVDPDEFAFEPDLPVDFRMTVTSAAFLTDAMTYSVTSSDPESLVLSHETIVRTGDQSLDVTFTAVAPAGSEGERSVVLTINDGADHETVWVLQAGDQSLPTVSIGRVFNFPNPMGRTTRFVYETEAARCSGTIRIFSTAGRTVAELPLRHEGTGNGIAEWDGRDNEGDDLANGTYLYRIELNAPGGRITSDVQRLVVMR